MVLNFVCRVETAQPTHVSLVLEGELAGGPPAVEVGGALPVEGAGRVAAVLGGAEALEPLLDDGQVLLVVVAVHLHVRCTHVHFAAAGLKHAHKHVTLCFGRVAAI